ncbi:MAG: ABC transporter ATP-binding protein [Acholeplasmataceae bacterium]
MSTLYLKDINKVYPNGVQAVFDFTLKIDDKEFIVFVGPSGCGKSTTLRMIAGLEEITSGELYIDDELINDKAPKDRNIAMVFQSYALYPHMTVYDNMAFGLKLRKVPKDVINEKVTEAAEILGLVPYLKRKPKALSGGQRQRVALGRAIVRNAKVFLMDEPLSNLDAKLRVQMRGELIKLHKKIETTTIYVTHDQIEAMTMADRIVVMRDGYIMQVGTPKDIYDNPNNLFVAGFIGTPPMNFIHGSVDEKGIFTAGQHTIKIPEDKFEIVKENRMIGKEIILGIRPEDIHDTEVVMKTYPEAVLDVKVDVAELLGAETNIFTNINNDHICASVDARADISIGNRIKLALDMNKCHFFDPETEQRLVVDINELIERKAATIENVPKSDEGKI